MGTVTNSDGPDKILHKAAFYQGLHYLLRQNGSLEKEVKWFFFFGNYNIQPSMYTMDHPDLKTYIPVQWRSLKD